MAPENARTATPTSTPACSPNSSPAPCSRPTTSTRSATPCSRSLRQKGFRPYQIQEILQQAATRVAAATAANRPAERGPFVKRHHVLPRTRMQAQPALSQSVFAAHRFHPSRHRRQRGHAAAHPGRATVVHEKPDRAPQACHAGHRHDRRPVEFRRMHRSSSSSP